MAFKYSEPDDFIPKSIRKELGLGEFNKDVKKKTTQKSKKKSSTKKKK